MQEEVPVEDVPLENHVLHRVVEVLRPLLALSEAEEDVHHGLCLVGEREVGQDVLLQLPEGQGIEPVHLRQRSGYRVVVLNVNLPDRQADDPLNLLVERIDLLLYFLPLEPIVDQVEPREALGGVHAFGEVGIVLIVVDLLFHEHPKLLVVDAKPVEAVGEGTDVGESLMRARSENELEVHEHFLEREKVSAPDSVGVLDVEQMANKVHQLVDRILEVDGLEVVQTTEI